MPPFTPPPLKNVVPDAAIFTVDPDCPSTDWKNPIGVKKFALMLAPAALPEPLPAVKLANVIPNAVSGEKDAVDSEGNPVYQGIDTSKLIATLTAAIQEQQELIKNLTDRIAALEAK